MSDTNVFEGNQAVYAPDIASYPNSYKFTFSQNGNLFKSINEDQVVFAPGQDIDLTVEIYDNEGRLFNDENEAICNVEFVAGQDLPAGSVILNPEQVASKGIIRFETLNIRQTPSTEASMQFKFTGLMLFGNTVEDFESPVAVKIRSRACK